MDKIKDRKRQVSGVSCKVSGVRCQVSGVRCQVSGVRCQLPSINLQPAFACLPIPKPKLEEPDIPNLKLWRIRLLYWTIIRRSSPTSIQRLNPTSIRRLLNRQSFFVQRSCRGCPSGGPNKCQSLKPDLQFSWLENYDIKVRKVNASFGSILKTFIHPWKTFIS